MPQGYSLLLSAVGCGDRFFAKQSNTPMRAAITPQAGTPAEGETDMLWTIFVILLLGWLIGWIGFHVAAWAIHLLLVAAIIVLIIRLFQGRRVA